MNIFNKKADAVADKLYKNPNISFVAYNPAIVLIILKILYEAFQLYKQCNKKPEEILDSLKKPSILEHARLRLLLFRKLGLFHRIQMGDLRASILEIGKETSLDEVKQMLNEEIPVELRQL